MGLLIIKGWDLPVELYAMHLFSDDRLFRLAGAKMSAII